MLKKISGMAHVFGMGLPLLALSLPSNYKGMFVVGLAYVAICIVVGLTITKENIVKVEYQLKSYILISLPVSTLLGIFFFLRWKSSNIIVRIASHFNINCTIFLCLIIFFLIVTSLYAVTFVVSILTTDDYNLRVKTSPVGT